MIVDPETGMPVDANTVAGSAGIAALEATGTDIPLGVDLLSSLPAAHHTVMWNMSRTANTMTKGGRRGLKNRLGVGQYKGRGIRQTFSPFGVRRLGSVENIDPLPGSRTYTPFNFMSRTGNKLAARASRGSTRAGRYVAGHLGPAGQSGEWFSAGTFGRVAAMGRIYGSSDKALTKMSSSVMEAFRTLNPNQYSQAFVRNTFSNIPTGGYGGMAQRAMKVSSTPINLAGRNELGQMVGLSMRGSISQKAAGYIHASVMNKAGVGVADATSLAVQGSNFSKGAAKFASHLEAGGVRGLAARSARFAPGVARAAGPVGYVLLARDLAVMSGKVVSHAAQTAIEAGGSIKGSLDKPIMGMGYRDNMVASTSRARGVQAIQNSRLNMRSALGNEAGAIHAAWG